MALREENKVKKVKGAIFQDFLKERSFAELSEFCLFMLDIILVLTQTGSQVQYNKFMMTAKPNHPFRSLERNMEKVLEKTNMYFR